MSVSDILAQIQDDVAVLIRAMERPDVAVSDLVDIGTTLAGVIGAAKDATDTVKSLLRAEALKTLGHEAGKAEFATATGQVVVTVPSPRMELHDHADMAALQTILGEDFSTFFEERVTYVPRRDIATLIIALPPGPSRDALLAAVTEKEQTPRVAFTQFQS